MNDQCQYRKDTLNKCGISFGLSIIYFRNPIQKYDNIEIALCQYHSDQVLRTMMESYNDCIKIEEKAFGKYKKGQQMAKKYETIQAPQDYQQLSNVRKLKYKILHSICRNLLCGKLLYQKSIYTATAYHSNGKMRHCFYFCSFDCYMVFKRMCGFRPKMKLSQKMMDSF